MNVNKPKRCKKTTQRKYTHQNVDRASRWTRGNFVSLFTYSADIPRAPAWDPGPYHGPGSTAVTSISGSFPNVLNEHVLLFSGKKPYI